MLSNKICQFLMFNLILLMCSDEDPLTSKAMGQQRQMTSSKSAGPAAIGHLIQFDGDNFDKFFEDSLPEYAKVNKPPKGNRGKPNQDLRRRSTEPATPESNAYTILDPEPSRPFQPLGHTGEPSIEYTQIAQTAKQGSFSSSSQDARNSLYPTIPKVEPTHIPQEYRR